eukprot:TRINITY_DN2178_c0_g1_i4.p1 TRINITY_DN2178_c0_g1~~TRINITY_DN2178_c0_g1_i4.p1  ORF type:complete len:344 (-),score=26.50 TRINITY_DN2178_c0_g1_i4:439-1470(-)
MIYDASMFSAVVLYNQIMNCGYVIRFRLSHGVKRKRTNLEVLCSSKKRFSREKYGDERKTKVQVDKSSDVEPVRVPGRIDPNSSVPVSKQIQARRIFEQKQKMKLLRNKNPVSTSYRKPSKTPEQIEEEKQKNKEIAKNKSKGVRQFHSAFHSWQFSKPDILLVDAYNIIHRHQKLEQVVQDVDLSEARRLCDKLFGEYMHLREMKIILVYDAQEGPPFPPYPYKREIQKSGLQVIFTGDTDADSFICQEVKRIVAEEEVRGVFVASSDKDVQIITRANGGYIVGVEYLLKDVKNAFKQLKRTLQQQEFLVKTTQHRGLRGVCDSAQLSMLQQLRQKLPARRV